jgi:sigma-70-like protein
MMLAAVAERDLDAMRALYDRHAGWLSVRLARRCNDPDMVADAVQDTFVAVWRKPRGFRGDGDVAAWLRARPPGGGPASCSSWPASRPPPPSATRTSSPAACGSARRSPWRWPASPDLLLADEPVSMLDVSVRAGVLALLDRLRRDGQMGILMITHDLSTAAHFADRIGPRGRLPAGLIVLFVAKRLCDESAN